jgi:hypothetical protein
MRAAPAAWMTVALLTSACGTSSSSAGQLDATTVGLAHVPSGTVTVTAADGSLQLSYMVRGLQPATEHAVAQHPGRCTAVAVTPRPSLTISADAGGAAIGVFNTPATLPLCLVIFAGPAAAPAQPVGLARLTKPGATVPLQAPGTPGSNPDGTAELSYDRTSRVLTVRVRITGLAPGSAHPNHVHFGRCELAGPIRYFLTPLTAGASGSADVTTHIREVDQLALGAWYVAVHAGPTVATQDQFSELLCGNV